MVNASPQLRSPEPARRKCERLISRREQLAEDQRKLLTRKQELAEYLAVADAVEAALDTLSQQLFGELVSIIEQQLTQALQEVLEQPIALKVERGLQRGAATLQFHVERQGKKEHVMDGQGGSVANILSVGLRLLALTTLDDRSHRRFLVLDEQDCWLHPALVPRLVKIVHDAGRALGFQVLMISHHEVEAFDRFADRIYKVRPTPEGAEVELVQSLEFRKDELDAFLTEPRTRNPPLP